MADLALSPATTTVGLIELVLFHEAPAPYFPGYNQALSFEAMRLMRQVLKNRLRHPGPFGAPHARDETDIIKIKSQFGAFAQAPNLPVAFMQNVYDILRTANNTAYPKQAIFIQHVQNAITAATETLPPSDLIVANLYYWRTHGYKGPGGRSRLYKTLQGLDFYTQNL
ncbi:hypothetical protein [uncultured Sphingomonas sp.]|uniref:hypothetical protein n=1 Tax=uncultured Sphingomonas sp. TaxID=158754 RepID=UPI0035CB6EA5